MCRTIVVRASGEIARDMLEVSTGNKARITYWFFLILSTREVLVEKLLLLPSIPDWSVTYRLQLTTVIQIMTKLIFDWVHTKPK